MKSTLHFFLFNLLLSSACFAQPTITIDDVTPEIGSSLPFTYVDYVDPGSSGENQVWDFSDLITNLSINIEFLAPEGVPGFQNFPEATHVISKQNMQFEFLKIANDSIDRLGFYRPQNGPNQESLTVYPDPMSRPIFPLNYTDTFSDGYSNQTNTEVVFGPEPGSLFYDESGNYDGIVDGYGTLVTPNGSFENVLRVTSTSTDHEFTSTLNGVPNNSGTTNFTSHFYYKAGVPLPLVSLSTSITHYDDGTVDTTTSCYYIPITTVSIDETIANNQQINMFPIPATTHLNLELESEAETEFGFTLFSIDGKTSHIWPVHRIQNGKNLIQLALPEVPSGMYLIQLQGENSLETRRVIIDR